MIRLPATSISLSENDIQLHMRDINIYHGLLTQGFKRRDIVRYYAEQRASTTGGDAPRLPPGYQRQTTPMPYWFSRATSPTNVGDIAPTCVELRGSAPNKNQYDEQEVLHKVGTTGLCNSPQDRQAKLLEPHLLDEESAIDNESHISTCSHRVASQSPPLLSQVNIPIRHAPRQSSLLRFTKNISPEAPQHSDDSSATSGAELYHTSLDNPDFLTSPHNRTRTYRPRSQTYPFVESDADDSGETAMPAQSIETELSLLTIEDSDHWSTANLSPAGSTNRMVLSPTIPIRPPVHAVQPRTSPLRPEADEFIPFSLPPPFSATRRIPSSQRSLSSSIPIFTTDIINSIDEHQSTNFLPLRTPPRSSSLSGTLPRVPSSNSHAFEYPSSPPPVSNHHTSSPSLPPPAPTSPQARRNRQSTTETRQSNRRQYDGSSFSVYNDKMPAHHQPQTPVDLSRRQPITERDVAYTAPPGMIIRNTFTTSQQRHGTILTEPGEQSPTIRAMDIRQRRNRETMRSFRVESSRWARLRELEMEGDEFMHFTMTGPGPALPDTWRDDLDADRVGEENFEDERGMRRDVRMLEDEQRGGRTARRPQ